MDEGHGSCRELGSATKNPPADSSISSFPIRCLGASSFQGVNRSGVFILFMVMSDIGNIIQPELVFEIAIRSVLRSNKLW
ncbi:hypothetical protein PSAB_23905 [Paenibacillus sabinae T27]|uniref:Uncharacterized protein n=1 Tax=Paenibacillus sabinae T27 TaxID=1268072 RepID=X5A5X0_9BACL|nr:hypothetical protein PSAB_23905 [Paenibacillus sabinae T27]